MTAAIVCFIILCLASAVVATCGDNDTPDLFELWDDEA